MRRGARQARSQRIEFKDICLPFMETDCGDYPAQVIDVSGEPAILLGGDEWAMATFRKCR